MVYHVTVQDVEGNIVAKKVDENFASLAIGEGTAVIEGTAPINVAYDPVTLEWTISLAAGTYADLVAGKVPETQLPLYTVLVYASLAAFPVTGVVGKLYIAIDSDAIYRWSGSAYVKLSSTIELGETSGTAYRGDRGKTAYDHTALTNNPHSVTKTQVGLGNCDDTSDMSKPVSTAQQLEIVKRPKHQNINRLRMLPDIYRSLGELQITTVSKNRAMTYSTRSMCIDSANQLWVVLYKSAASTRIYCMNPLSLGFNDYIDKAYAVHNVAAGSQAVLFAGGYVWVSLAAKSYKIDIDTYSATELTNGFGGAILTSDDVYIYAAYGINNSITRTKLSDNTQTTWNTDYVLQNLILVISATDYLYASGDLLVGATGTDVLCRFNKSNGALATTMAFNKTGVGPLYSRSSLFDGFYLWVHTIEPDDTLSILQKIELDTLTVVATVTLSNDGAIDYFTYSENIYLGFDGKYLYVSGPNGAGFNLIKIDVDSNEIASQIPIDDYGHLCLADQFMLVGQQNDNSLRRFSI